MQVLRASAVALPFIGLAVLVGALSVLVGAAAIGMVLGTIVSWLAVRSADSLLFGVTPRDPGTFAGMLVVLTCVALIAGYLPARRASRVDPMVALRTE